MSWFNSVCARGIAARIATVVVGLALCAATAAGVDVQVTRVDGSVVEGAVAGSEAGIQITTASGSQSLAWDQVLAIDVVKGAGAEVQSPNPKGGLRIALSDGSEFNAAIERVLEGDLLLRLSDGQMARVAPDSIRWIRRDQAPSAVLARQAEAWAELDRSGPALQTTEDVAVVAKADQPLVLRGAVRRVDASGVRFQWNGRELPLEWGRLAGVRFARPQGRTAATLVTTRDGTIFAGRPVGADASELVLRSSAFDGIKLPWDSLSRLEVRSGKIVYLSDLIPQNYEFDPLFGPPWGYGMNRSLSGDTVRLEGRTFSKALTMHSQSRIFFAVPAGAHRFAATVGVVEEFPHGRVNLRVLGDDRVLWSAEGVQGGESPREVSIEIQGVHVLQLAVDWGADLDLGDHVAWGQARLVRE